MGGELDRSTVRLVGGFRVEFGDQTLSGPALSSRRGRHLLQLLAIDSGHTFTAGQLAERLWPSDQPKRPDQVIASLVSRLRAVLGADAIGGGREGYRLGSALAVDLDLAKDLIDESAMRLASNQPALAITAAQRAMSLLAGTVALGEDGDAEWADSARATQRDHVRQACLTGATGALEVGDLEAAESFARRVLAANPLDEQAVALLMSTLDRGGNSAAALVVYDEVRRALADELGADPSEAVESIHLGILRRDGSRAAPVGVRGQAIRQPSLAGRADEVAQLSRHWESAANGRGSMVLIDGEAGIGKTRLMAEVSRLAAQTGGTVLSARCYEAERSLFLQPIAEALGQYTGSTEPARVRDAIAGHVGPLARLVPEIAAVASDAAVAAEHANPEIERRRVFEGVVGFVLQLAASQPVLLCVDDLQNGGYSTVELLHFLGGRLPTSKALVVATIRDDEGAETIQALAPVSETIHLSGLSVAAVSDLAAAAGHANQAADIARRSGGHALYVTEILRAFSEGESGIPESLAAAVVARVGRSGEQVGTLLRAGAVLGASFDPTVAGALAGLGIPDTLAACERALRARLLATSGRNYEFANDIVRDVIYAETPSPTRLAYHARAADILVDHPESVAAHCEAIGDRPRADRAWLVAAEQALSRFAMSDAASLAGKVVESAGERRAEDVLGRALLVRARAREALTEFDDAWSDLQRAADAARIAGDRRLEMAVLRQIAGDVSVALGLPPRQREPVLRDGLAIARDLGDRTAESDLLGRLSVLASNRLLFKDALATADEAMRSAQASADGHALMYALDARKTALGNLGHLDELTATCDELIRLERQLGDSWYLQWTLFERSYAFIARGQWAAALESIETAISVCRDSGQQAHECWFTAHLGWVKRLSGDLPAALEIGAQATKAARAHGHVWWLAAAAAMYASSLQEAGQSAEAIALLEETYPSADVEGAEAYLFRCLCPLAELTGSADILRRADDLLASIQLPEREAWFLGVEPMLSLVRSWRKVDRDGDASRLLDSLAIASKSGGWTVVRAQIAELS